MTKREEKRKKKSKHTYDKKWFFPCFLWPDESVVEDPALSVKQLPTLINTLRKKTIDSVRNCIIISVHNSLVTQRQPTHFAIQSISLEVFGKLLHVAGEAPVSVHFWVQHLQKATAQIIHTLSVTYFCRDQRSKRMMKLDNEYAKTVLHSLTTRCRPTSANKNKITNTAVTKFGVGKAS